MDDCSLSTESLDAFYELWDKGDVSGAIDVRI